MDLKGERTLKWTLCKHSYNLMLRDVTVDVETESSSPHPLLLYVGCNESAWWPRLSGSFKTSSCWVNDTRIEFFDELSLYNAKKKTLICLQLSKGVHPRSGDSYDKLKLLHFMYLTKPNKVRKTCYQISIKEPRSPMRRMTHVSQTAKCHRKKETWMILPQYQRHVKQWYSFFSTESHDGI